MAFDALVTDAQFPSAIAGLRGLGRAGLRVLVVSPSRAAAGRWSRSTAGAALAPDPSGDPEGFVQEIGRLADARGPFVVYPGGEAALEALLDGWPSLPPNARLPYPNTRVVDAVRNKAGLSTLARAAGIRTPRTATGDADSLAGADLPFPLVVKPAYSTGTLRTAHIVHSWSALQALIKGLPPGEELIAQEHVRGPLMSVTLVVSRDGVVLERFQQLASRTWPVAAGPTALGRSVSPDERLVSAGASALVQAGYWGLAQLQFISAPDGPRLVDVNPRFYGSLGLALAAGVNLPAAWHAAATGAARAPTAKYLEGVSYRWLEADVSAALHGSPSRLVRRPPRPRTGAVWRADDPVPGLLIAAAATSMRLRRLLSSAR